MDLNKEIKINGILSQILQSEYEVRVSLLKHLCRDEPEIYAGVLPLLEQDHSGHVEEALNEGLGFLGQLDKKTLEEVDFQAAQAHGIQSFTGVYKEGDEIGPFRIKEKIAKGGMGCVYLAVRSDDLDLKVALKVLWHRDPHLLQLFRAECKILSSLNHPGIARLIDAGTTASDEPWMAMEFISGLRLDQYIQEKKPDIQTRVRMIHEICEALNYAHHQMIIHKDLKPGNIMVTDSGKLKLLDFGIASTLDAETGEQSNVTRFQDRILTPLYASPEQLAGSRLSAASDVYSMGVILHEVLTGQLPHGLKKDLPAAFMYQQLKEQAIPRPSTLKIDGNKLACGPQFRGDLDVIVCKALAFDANERYASIEHLHHDLSCYLEGHPISSRPATFSYRMKKFVCRNPLLASLGLGFVLFLLIFSFYAHWQGKRVTAERDYALSQQQRAEAVSDYLVQIFQAADPDASLEGDYSVKHILNQGMEQMALTISDPATRARLASTMGQVYASLGDDTRSSKLLREAADRTIEQGGNPVDDLIRLSQIQNRAMQFRNAEETLDEIEAYREQFTPTNQALYFMAKGIQVFSRGDFKLADTFFEKAQALEALDPSQNMALQDQRADLFEEWGFLEKALAIRLRILEKLHDLYGSYHSQIGDSLLDLARLRSKTAHFDKTETLLDQAAEVYEALYDKEHPKWARLYLAQGGYHFEQARLTEALDFAEKAEAHLVNIGGENHRNFIEIQILKANALFGLGKLERARKEVRDSLLLVRQLKGKDNVEYAQMLLVYAGIEIEMGAFPQAEEFLVECRGIVYSVYGDAHYKYADVLNDMGRLYRIWERNEEAGDFYKKALAIRRASMGENHPTVALGLNNLGTFYYSRGQLEKADTFFKQAADIHVQHSPKNSQYARYLSNRAYTCVRLKRFKLAESVLQEAVDIYEADPSTSYTSLISIYSAFRALHMATDKKEKALPFAQKAVAVIKKETGEVTPFLAEQYYYLAELEFQLGRHEDALIHAKHSHDFYKKLGLEDSDTYKFNLINLINIYEAEGAYEKVHSFASEGFQKTARKYGEDNWLAVLFQSLKAVSQSRQSDATLKSLEETYAKLSRNNGNDHWSTKDTLRRLVQGLELAGRSKEAQSLREALKP